MLLSTACESRRETCVCKYTENDREKPKHTINEGRSEKVVQRHLR